jgi:glycosyltransferase involved in cell wall biosynthesis
MTGVLLVMGWRPSAPGGVTTAVQNMREALQLSRKVTVELLVDTWECPTLHTELIAGRKIYLLRVASPYYKGRGLSAAVGFAFGFVRTAKQISKLVRVCNVGIVNVHFPGLEVVLWSLLIRLRLYRGRLILSFHGADVTLAAAGRSAIERLLWQFSIRAATGLTACSAALARELTALFPFAAPKIYVVPNGVSADTLISEAASSAVLENAAPLPYILCIAALEPKKGVDVLLRAFATVLRHYSTLKLALLCRAGPEMGAIQALIQELGLNECVDLQIDCAHERAMRMLMGAEALVLPSRKEPFGIVVLEAAVFERPVVLTSICGVLESLPTPPPLSVVAPDDPDALARAIMCVFTDREAAHTNARALKSYVVNSLTWSSAATQLLSVYGLPADLDNPGSGRTATS